MRFVARAIVAISLLGLPLAGASAQDKGRWTHIHDLNDGRVFIDRSTLRSSGGQLFINSRIEFNAAREDGVMRTDMLFRYDCAAHSAALLSFQQYRGDGSVVRNVDVPADRVTVQRAAEGSPNDSILNDICR